MALVAPLLLLAACTMAGDEPPTGTAAEEVSVAEDADRVDARNEAVTVKAQPAFAAAQIEDADERSASPKRMRTRQELVDSHGKWVRALLDEAPARVSVRSGALEWRMVQAEEPGQPAPSTWLEAQVVASRSCGAPEKLTVRVPYHSELPGLQPEDGKQLLFFGSMDDEGVLTAVWASPYQRERVPVHHVEVPLSADEVFGACDEGGAR